MGIVERLMMDAIPRLIAAGAKGVTEEQVLGAVIPTDHPECRSRPSYKHGFARLRRRGLLTAVWDEPEGWKYAPTRKALKELANKESHA
jgi:hypothetical protein